MSAMKKQNKVYKLTDLIGYYELCNRAEGKSIKTITWYSANLARFQSYLKRRHLPDSITYADTKLLREYIIYLLKQHRFADHPYTPAKAEPLSASTVHGHVRTLRAFFGWLVREGFAESNIAKELKPPKLGSKVGELVNLKMGDVNMSEGLMKVIGKGKKERIVPMGSNAQRALQRYLFRHRPVLAHAGIENVFLSVHGTSLTENSMKLMFARLAKRSGVQRLHAHLCRHTFATRFLINGGDVFTLQQILGHSTLEMVRRYINLASNHVALQHKRFSPLDRLNLHKA